MIDKDNIILDHFFQTTNNDLTIFYKFCKVDENLKIIFWGFVLSLEKALERAFLTFRLDIPLLCLTV